MDLKQTIPLKTGGAGDKKAVYPSKTTINLVADGRSRDTLFTQVGLFVVVLVLVGVFAKFAVIDPLAQGAASSAQVTEAQAHLDALKAENADYAELNERYARYVVAGLTEDEQNLADRDTMLDVLQEKVLNAGYLSSLKISGNTATVVCLGVDLSRVSGLVQSVESDENVSHVTVSTAQGENDAATSATIEITFKGPLDVPSGNTTVGSTAGATGKGAAQ